MLLLDYWKPIVGFEGRYEVSVTGAVRSLPRAVGNAHGTKSQRKAAMLSPGLASNGYRTVAIGRGNTRTIHSLIAEAFIGPCPNGKEVLHNDGDRQNSRLSNLRYGTRRENILDSVAHGTWMSPSRSAHCKQLRRYRAGAAL